MSLTSTELSQSLQGALWPTLLVPRAIACVFVIFRYVARRVAGTNLWWDDWIIFTSTVLVLIPETVIEIAQIMLGLGRHLEEVVATSPQNLLPYLKLIYTDSLAYPLVITPIKCSILCLYIRLFGVSQWLTRWCLFLIASSILWGLTTLFLFTFSCNPVENDWAPSREGCFDFVKLSLGTNIPNVVMNFLILGTPLPIVWRLKLAATKKFIVSAVFLFGMHEVAISIIRAHMLTTTTFIDVTWSGAIPIKWSSLECSIGTICCCLPVLAPLLPRWIQARLSSRIAQRQALIQSPPVARGAELGGSDMMKRSEGDSAGGMGSIRCTTDIQTVSSGFDTSETNVDPYRLVF